MIKEFQGPYRFLSNFWAAEVHYDSYIFPSVEHAYQYAKEGSPEFAEKILACRTAGDAKRLGKKAKLCSHWDSLKLPLMQKLVRRKFTNPQLATELLATWPQELQEGNRWGDTFWGVCAGEGKNHLGEILMDVRAELRELSNG